VYLCDHIHRKARHEGTQKRRKAKSLLIQERFIKRQFYLP